MQIDLVLIRHGQTAGNAENRYIGQSTNPPLTARGREQLLAWKEANRYPSADALYVSPLARCRETASLLYPMLVPVVLPSLIDLDLGSFEGKTYDELKEDPAYRRWIESRGMIAPPGGESGAEFSARLASAIHQIGSDAGRCGFHRATLITHAGCILTLLQGVPADASSPVPYTAPNGGGYQVRLDPATGRLSDPHPHRLSAF